MRVVYYTLYIPHYRDGVFSQLTQNPSIDFTVCANINFPIGFSLIKPSDVSFHLIDRKTYIIHLPFTKIKLYFQPEAVLSMLMGKYDVFLMSNQMTQLTVWINIFLGRLLGRCVCLWGHGFTKREGIWNARLRKIMMHLSHVNIFYSESGRDKAIQMGLAPEKLFVAYNALDTRRSKAIRESISFDDLECFRKENNLIDKKIVIFSGRLQRRKRPEILILASQKVIQNQPNVLVIIIGDGEMREELMQMIKNLKLENNIWLLGEVFDEEILARYFLSSSVAVMPAHAGLVIQHAFDYGVPIVVGDDMEGHPPEIELVKNGYNGILCKDGDVNEFAEAIFRLLSNQKEHQRMSKNCRKVIIEKYNVENMAKGIIDALTYGYKVNFNGT